jgi:hypothetical protein
MSTPPKARFVVYVLPMIVALVAARQLASSLRPVDFLSAFAAGAIFGVSLVSLIRVLRGGGTPRT